MLTRMSATLPSLRSVAIRESVVDVLRNALLEGKFAPGENLSEPTLAAQLGVSRGPVRESLLVLEQEGLVVHAQNRGFAVPTFGPADRPAMMRVRLPLETLALELAKDLIQPNVLAELEKSVDAMVATYLTDPRACAREDLMFHEKLWDATGNPWLQVALKRIARPFFMHAIMYRKRTPGLDTATFEEQHRAYLAFLRGQSSASAEDCVRFHISTHDPQFKQGI